jgi:phenylalanine-4-hydroxylase
MLRLRSLARRAAAPLRRASSSPSSSPSPSPPAPRPADGSRHGAHARSLAASFVEEGLRGGDSAGRGMASLVFSTHGASDGPGGLMTILRIFERAGLSLSRIESRPAARGGAGHDFFVDVEDTTAARVEALLVELRAATRNPRLALPTVVPWFPMHARDIDSFSTKTLDAGAELEADHPGFSDAGYRARRRAIVEAAASFRHGEAIPRVAYTAREVETWALVYRKLRAYTAEFAVDSYNAILPELERHAGYGERSVPQLQDVSDFLRARTGFSLRPVGGLLSARDFLNALAFRVFFSTQYIRHDSRPLYTPEPDVCHELLGHAPMFADPDFADFSHEIGLASLGASDDDIKKLATCYWFSVEFGLCLAEKGAQRRAYGAGLLSSFGELEYACGGGAGDAFAGGAPAAAGAAAAAAAKAPEFRVWDPAKAAVQPYPITSEAAGARSAGRGACASLAQRVCVRPPRTGALTSIPPCPSPRAAYQPVYFVAASLADAKARMRAL